MKAPTKKTSDEASDVPLASAEPALRLEASGATDHRDAERVARIKSGDVGAFETVVRAYARPLTAFAYGMVRSSELAADLTQDVFAHIWERRDAIEIHGSLRAYLYRAVRNRAMNALRHQHIVDRFRHSAALGGESSPRSAPSAERELEAAELAASVQAALNSLPPRTREVARLRWQEQMSLSEIATVMEIATPTVSNLLGRAAKRMRALLAGVWP
ncbi:MAG TPA: RNA polymerase sigma-70 factor [Gemmatimonadaceae bacterium]|nr:RNA polymerase sigma-70 factor [Gemmatimonadaceae bacterium]